MKKLTKSLVLLMTAAAIAVMSAACGDQNTQKPSGKTDKYTVTYSIGEAHGTAPTETDKAEGEKFAVKSADGLTNGDKIFGGWNDGIKTYAAGDMYTMPGKNVTFSAQWKLPQAEYTVTYKPGEHGTGDDVVENGVSGIISIKANPFTAESDYVFAGWKIQGDESDKIYAAGAAYQLTADVVFVAQWATEYVGVELDYKGVLVLNFATGKGELLYSDSMGEELSAALTFILDGSDIEISVGGGKFNGKYENGAVTVTLVFAGVTYRFGEMEQPEVTAPEVSFDANGGTGSAPVISDDDITYDNNAQKYKFKLPQNTFSAPHGKEFDKWTIGNLDYKPGTTYFADPGEKVRILAKWKDVSPELPTGTAFIGNWNTPASTGILGVPIPGVNVTKVYIDTERSVAYYVIGDQPTAKKSTLSTASNMDESIYGADAGYFEMKIENVAYNVLIKADKTRLCFCSISTDEKYEGSEFTADGGEIPPVSEYTVTIDPRNEEEVTTVKIVPGEKVSRPADPVHPQNKTFRYWAYEDGVTGAVYQYNFDLAVTGDLNLFAVYGWKVTFVITEGNGSIDPVWVDIWSTGIILPDDSELNNGSRVLVGWWDGTYADTAQTEKNIFKPGERYRGSGHAELRTEWADPVLTYVITFEKAHNYGDRKDVTGDVPETERQEAGDKFVLPKNPFTKPGHVFNGWRIQKLGDNGYTYVDIETVAEDSEYTMPSFDIRIVPDWQSVAYSITYKPGDHGTGADVKTENIIGAVKIAACGFAVDNFWTFVGWKLDGDTSDKIYEAGSSFTGSGTNVFVATYVNAYSGDDSTGSNLIYLNFAENSGMLYTANEQEYAIGITTVGNRITLTVNSVAFNGTFVNNALNIKLTAEGVDYIFGTPPDGIKRTVTFVLGDGAQGTVPTVEDKEEGETFVLPTADGMTNGDLVFAGWSDGEKTYAAGAEYIMPAKAVVFTAQWKEPGEIIYETVALKDFVGKQFSGNTGITLDNSTVYTSISITWHTSLGYRLKLTSSPTSTLGRTFVTDVNIDLSGNTFTAVYNKQIMSFAFVKNGDVWQFVVLSIKTEDGATEYVDTPVFMDEYIA